MTNNMGLKEEYKTVYELIPLSYTAKERDKILRSLIVIAKICYEVDCESDYVVDEKGE